MFKEWYKSGTPWIWLNAGAVSISVVMVVTLIALIAIRGLNHFWPKEVIDYSFYGNDGSVTHLIGETYDTEIVPARQISAKADPDVMVERKLIKIGNREINGLDFRWIVSDEVAKTETHPDLMVLERKEWGNFYGFLSGLQESGREVVPENGHLYGELHRRLQRATDISEEIEEIEKDEIGSINYDMEQIRLAKRRLELKGIPAGDEKFTRLNEEKNGLNADYQQLQAKLTELYGQIGRDTLTARVMSGEEVTISLSNVVQAYLPNSMTLMDKIGFYLSSIGHFVFGEPREANTEGGVFPALFGTVLMVILMAIVVTPFGVIAAVYLKEYADQGVLTRLIRIAVNNLAGVPSIVYGVFGLGFFVYFMGQNID
ncbi:MAG: phosphate ABC transporter, permease protein PstA, partial [Gammaproteobacteria bacterium]|nr:phosphate ABC transporter, permease protein PstA [Gammaproteobacteria bacterium]